MSISATRFSAIISLIALLLLNNVPAIAGKSCSQDILGLKPGMTKGSARSLMLKQGFRELQGGRNAGMLFTNEEIWPPEGVRLSRQQMSILQDPGKRAYAEKLAETDPVYAELLASIKGIPPKPDRKDMGIHVTLGGLGKRAADNTPVRGISVRYRFPSDVYGSTPVYSPEHQLLNDSRWEEYCPNIDVSKLDHRRFMDQDGASSRMCQDDPLSSGIPFQITIRPLSRGDASVCNYEYYSRPKEVKESLM